MNSFKKREKLKINFFCFKFTFLPIKNQNLRGDRNCRCKVTNAEYCIIYCVDSQYWLGVKIKKWMSRVCIRAETRSITPGHWRQIWQYQARGGLQERLHTPVQFWVCSASSPFLNSEAGGCKLCLKTAMVGLTVQCWAKKQRSMINQRLQRFFY